MPATRSLGLSRSPETSALSDDLRFQQIERERVSDRVAQELLKLIGSGRLAPGERLPGERQLAEMMNVSRVSIRSALQQLKAKGLITSVQGGGTRIAKAAEEIERGLTSLVRANNANLHELIEIRSMLEVWAARRAAEEASTEQRLAIRRAFLEMDSLPADDAQSLLGAPIPIVAGCSERTFASLEDVDGVHVLRLGEKCALSGATPEPPRSLVAAFDGVSCAAPPHVGWVCDAALVAPARRAAADYINELVGDLATNSVRYGVVDRDSGDFEFVPDWFLAPREEALVMARKLAHTQMLCSFVAERRAVPSG